MHKKYSRRGFITLSGLAGLIPSAMIPNPMTSGNINQSVNTSKHTVVVPDLDKIKELIKQTKSSIWLFTGDSITEGGKHTSGWRSYPEIFAERVRSELGRTRDIVINTGISGNICDNILEDFVWRVKQFKPAMVSVMIGANDCVRTQISAQYFKDKLTSLVSRVRELNAIPVLHTPNFLDVKQAPHCKRLPEFVTVVRDVTKEVKTVLVDNWSHWQGAANDGQPQSELYKTWLADPVHPNNKGHSQIAQLLFKSIEIFDEKSFTCKDLLNE